MQDDRTQILLIEEEPILAEVTRFRLELLGYEVVLKSKAEDAFTWLKQNRPEMVIVDQILPGMEGLEFLNRLSNDEQTSEIPTILLSSNSDLDNVQKAHNAGADAYLVTPYDPLVLERKVEALLTGTPLGTPLNS